MGQDGQQAQGQVPHEGGERRDQSTGTSWPSIHYTPGQHRRHMTCTHAAPHSTRVHEGYPLTHEGYPLSQGEPGGRVE